MLFDMGIFEKGAKFTSSLFCHLLNYLPLVTWQVGVFKAGFLVVTSLEHPYNNLGDLQRAKWSPTAASLLGTLDIGWAIATPLFWLKRAHNHIMNT